MTSPAFTQITFRLRYDNGSESGATWRAAENTNATINVAENFRVRVRFDETASRAWSNQTFTWQYQKNGSGGYASISGSTPVQYSLSDNFANGADCTTQLSGGTGTFVTDNNGMLESSAALVNSGTAGYLFETEICLQLDPAQMANGDYVDVRLSHASYTITYTNTPRITASKIAPTSTDGVTVGESKTVLLPDALGINVTDGLTVGDTNTVEVQQLAREINVTDGITLGDSVNYYTEDVLLGESVTVVIEEAVADRNIPDAADNITLGEAVTVWTDTYRINVSDGLTVGESKTVENTTLIRSVTDGLTVGESQSIQNTTLTTSVTDGLTVGESKSIENTTLYRSVSDGLTVGETNTQVTSNLQINVTDGLTAADVLTNIVLGAVGEIEIDDVSDNVNIGESKTVEITTLYRSITDGLTVGETKSVEIASLLRSVTDGITVGETKSVEITSLSRSVTDGLTIGESKTVTVSSLNISVTDGITVGESKTVTSSSLIVSVTDGLTVGESKTITVSALNISVTDGLTVADVLTNIQNPAAGEIVISVSDGIVLGESNPVSVSDLITSVTDNVGVADALTNIEVSAAGSLSINVSDGITLADSVNYFTEDVLLGESLTIEVYTPAVGTLYINVSDDVYVGEAPFSGWGYMEITVTDGITLGESSAAELSPPTTFSINVADGITLGESKTVQRIDAIFINIGWEDEKVQIDESVQVVVSDPSINIAAGVENVAVSDGTLLVVLPEEGTFYINITDGIQLAEIHSQTVDGLQINIAADDEKVAVEEIVSVDTALRIDVSDNVQLNYSLLALFKEVTVKIPNLYAGATDNAEIGELNNLFVVQPYDITHVENIHLHEHIDIAIVYGEGNRGCAVASDELSNMVLVGDEAFMSVVASDEPKHSVVIGDVNCD